jgi:hypothetical protein
LQEISKVSRHGCAAEDAGCPQGSGEAQCAIGKRKTNFFVIGFSLRLPTRFDGIEDNVNSRPQPSRQHAVRNPKSPVLYSGQCAWGKRFAEDGVTLEVDEYEQNVTAVVRHMRESGYKLRQIVDSLRELGVVGRTGKPIGTTRVFEIIHGARKKPGRSSNGSNGNGSSNGAKESS